MDLTGKCLKDFYNHLNKDYKECDFAYDLNINDFSFKTKTEQNALIIDFFDSVGIIITISEDSFNHVNEEENKDYWYLVYSYLIKKYSDIDDGLNDYKEYYSTEDFNNRQEALTEAIKKANEIYNNLFLPK